MSTATKIDKTKKIGKGRRREALAFFRQQATAGGSIGIAAAAVYVDLMKIHRAPYLTGEEKESGFQVVIRRYAGRDPLSGSATPEAAGYN